MKSQDSKALSTPSEKPNHYTYLKEFRVEQCQLFLQHKCSLHRPFQCFNWHFLNQRRRRPIRKRDGTFNYSPDVYCTKFDENTGICPDGDECSNLHRTAGDTERRYHLRYYKTGMCVHDTDARGLCAKNGAHCAFAHGVDDVRPPVYDIRELQAMETGDHELVNGIGPISQDKERNACIEDPRWQETAYVLANYKTEPCKRPPRLCRQGYACPQYHNSRDKRRPPKKFKYRSTACPNVKHGDEWGEPSNCDSGDTCQYCHSRTEQQFHPEIYKSTKCNDIQQNSYCPRGAFCAFAHVEQEMTQVRETAANENCSGTSLADILQSALPPGNPLQNSISTNNFTSTTNSNSIASNLLSLSNSDDKHDSNEIIASSLPSSQSSQLAPIGSKPRHLSGNSIITATINNSKSCTESILGFSVSLPANSYAKAPGSEREDSIFKKQLGTLENENIDPWEKSKRKRIISSFNVSPLAPPFYPTSDTVQSVVGSALEDLSVDDNITINSSIETKFDDDCSLTNSIGSSLPITASSAPVNIPKSNYHERNLAFGQSASSTSSPGFSHSLSALRDNSLDQVGQNYLRNRNSVGSSGISDNQSIFGLGTSSLNPLSESLSQSPLINSMRDVEIQRLRDELISNQNKLVSWEEGVAQARQACQAWKLETEQAQRKAQIAEQAKDDILVKLTTQQKDLEELRSLRLNLACVQTLHSYAELDSLPLQTLKAIHTKLKSDIHTVEKAINNYSMKNDQWPGTVATW